jgi:hypothetical protein
LQDEYVKIELFSNGLEEINKIETQDDWSIYILTIIKPYIYVGLLFYHRDSNI